MANTRDQSSRDESPETRERPLIQAARQQVEGLDAVHPTRTAPDGNAAGSKSEGYVEPLPDAISGYHVVRRIHGGGQGVVYEAVQTSTQRKVAIKVLLEGPFAGPASRERFRREISLVAGLDHPNIVKVLDSGVAAGKYFYAMDYVRGATLDQWVKETEPTSEQVVALLAKVCDAIDYAHRKGVIHRDIKPSNILVDRRGEPHLVDFGMAKVAGGDLVGSSRPMLVSITGQVVGTLPYMSPEQALGDTENLDARTDIYSLGVVLYQLLTGQFPYEVVGNMRDVLDNILRAEPKRPSTIRRNLDDDVETIILKALSKEPERRYQSAAALRLDLAHFLSGEPIQAKRDSGWYVFRKSVRRHRRAIAVASLVGLIVVAAAMIVLYSIRYSRREAMRANSFRQQAQETERKVELYEERLARDEFRAAFSGLTVEPVSPPPDDWTHVDRAVTLHINIPEKPTVFNPLHMQNSSDIFVCELIFEGLFRRTSDLSLIPNEHLVSGIDDTDDPHVKLVHLRPNVRWHDGKPFTSDDVVFSWQQVIKKEVGSSRRVLARRFADVQSIDTHTVEFVQRELSPTWRLSMNFELVPKHLFERHATEDPTLRNSEYYRALHRQPVGCGPFRFLASGSEEETTLERWEDYAGQKAYVRRLVVHRLSDPAFKLEAFLRGGLDVFQLTDDQYRDEVFNDTFAHVGVHARHPGEGFHYILWNCEGEANPFFHDASVRLAMAHAVNLDRIITQVTNNLAPPCCGPWSVESPFFDTHIRRLRYSLDGAADLLDAAGWRLDENGVRAKDLAGDSTSGTRTPFLFSILVYSPSESSVQIAEILQESLEKIGIGLAIEKEADAHQFTARMQEHRFDAVISELKPAADPDLTRSLFGTGGRQNFGRYSNAEVDRLFEEGARLLDPEERAACYRKIHRLIYDDQPMTFLYHRPSLWAINKRLRGVEFSARGPYLFYPGIRNWWVPKDAGEGVSSPLPSQRE